ncbi:hypothetical protein MTR_3g073200 [Medicago truncatula]|uniref:Uncharacterized protein n=1 Tax=Medicago truncatula TaxID=3880 RepID=G7J3N2_MEDTR|nr:hypothetical protein MTR_3g073200 [Medicago truncatula]
MSTYHSYCGSANRFRGCDARAKVGQMRAQTQNGEKDCYGEARLEEKCAQAETR